MGLLRTEVQGWKFDKKKKKLAEDLHKVFFVHECDMLCICELGEIGEGLSETFPDGTIKLFEEIWRMACNIENESDDSEEVVVKKTALYSLLSFIQTCWWYVPPTTRL